MLTFDRILFTLKYKSYDIKSYTIMFLSEKKTWWGFGWFSGLLLLLENERKK